MDSYLAQIAWTIHKLPFRLQGLFSNKFKDPDADMEARDFFIDFVVGELDEQVKRYRRIESKEEPDGYAKGMMLKDAFMGMFKVDPTKIDPNRPLMLPGGIIYTPPGAKAINLPVLPSEPSVHMQGANIGPMGPKPSKQIRPPNKPTNQVIRPQ